MTLAEVEHLLGSPGTEVTEQQLPHIVDWDVPIDHPRRVKPAISGERYFKWVEGTSYIIVSMNSEIVAEKWYWEPSL